MLDRGNFSNTVTFNESIIIRLPIDLKFLNGFAVQDKAETLAKPSIFPIAKPLRGCFYQTKYSLYA